MDQNKQHNPADLHATRLTADVVYDAIEHDGEVELARHPLSLWWSAIAAGFAMSVCIFITSIPAGFLVAAIVWMLPNGRGHEFWLVLFMAYAIGLGAFPHVIVGSVEAFLLLWDAQMLVSAVLLHYLLPALVGNIIGGTLLFSVLAYGQVRNR